MSNASFVLTDEVCLRQNDITFALTAVLNLMSPSAGRTFASGSQNLKTMSEIRTASMTYNSRDAKIVSGLTPFVYKVAFLGKYSRTYTGKGNC